MPESRRFPVLTEDGRHGLLIAPARFLDDRPEKLVRFDDGSEETVPSDALQPQPDGSFYLRRRGSPERKVQSEPERKVQAENVQSEAVPAGPADASRTLAPTAQPLEDGNPTAAVDSALPHGAEYYRHGFNVHRVPVNRVIEEPIRPRQEGDTMIYPVIEEVIVVQKKLVLREEIHVTPERTAIAPRRLEYDADSSDR